MIETLAGREKGFEAEFARNEELAFRLAARRNRLFGLWVAERLELPAAESSAYAAAAASAALDAQSEEDFIRNILADLTARGRDIREAELRRELARAADTARQEIFGA